MLLSPESFLGCSLIYKITYFEIKRENSFITSRPTTDTNFRAKANGIPRATNQLPRFNQLSQDLT